MEDIPKVHNFDFNATENDGNDNDLIPDGTIAPVRIEIAPGGTDPDGLLTTAQNSDVIMLCIVATVLSGAYAEHNFWVNIMLDGGKRDKEGRSICGNIGRQQIRAILESARNIRHDDMSETASAGRRITGWNDIDGLTFWAVIGVKTDKTGNYPDKNCLKRILTPGMKGYGGIEASPTDAPAVF